MKQLRQLTLLLACLAFSFSAEAQTTSLKITETPEYRDKTVKRRDINAICASDEGMLGILRESLWRFYFEVFDENYQKVFSEDIKKEKRESFVGYVHHGDKMKMITVQEPKKKERIVYCYTFDIPSKSYKKSKLFEASVEKKQPLFSGANKRQTSLSLSPNGQYLAITTDNRKKNLNSYDVRVFDAESLELLFTKSFNDHEKKFYEQNDIYVTDNKEVFVIGKQFLEGRREKKEGKSNYDFVLNKITENDIKTTKIDIGDDEHIQTLKINNKETLQLVGFYSERRVSQIKGVCNFLVDKQSLEVADQKLIELPKSVYDDLYGYRRAKRKKGQELSNFFIDHVIEDVDGSTTIVAEEFYITHSYVHNQFGGTSTVTYHYDDILVIRLNNEGNLEWGRSIFKRDGKPSYNVFYKNSSLHVFLNSGKKLLKKDDGRTKVSRGLFESSALYDIEFKPNGEVSYNKIQDNKGKEKSMYLPFFGVETLGKFIMENHGKLTKCFMVLE